MAIVMHTLFLKGRITVEGNNDDKARNKKEILIMLHLDHAYQTHLSTMQKILILPYQCIIC